MQMTDAAALQIYNKAYRIKHTRTEQHITITNDEATQKTLKATVHTEN